MGTRPLGSCPAGACKERCLQQLCVRCTQDITLCGCSVARGSRWSSTTAAVCVLWVLVCAVHKIPPCVGAALLEAAVGAAQQQLCVCCGSRLDHPVLLKAAVGGELQ